MHLSLPTKTASMPPRKPSGKPMTRTAKLLLLYVSTFLLIVLLGACSTPNYKPLPPVDVGRVVEPDKVNLGPLPQVVADTAPFPAGHFQTRRLERETLKLKQTTTHSTPTASISPMPPAAPTR